MNLFLLLCACLATLSFSLSLSLAHIPGPPDLSALSPTGRQTAPEGREDGRRTSHESPHPTPAGRLREEGCLRPPSPPPPSPALKLSRPPPDGSSRRGGGEKKRRPDSPPPHPEREPTRRLPPSLSHKAKPIQAENQRSQRLALALPHPLHSIALGGRLPGADFLGGGGGE